VLTTRLEQQLPSKKDILLVLETIRFYNSAIEHYGAVVSLKEDPNIADVNQVMYFVYLQQAMKLHGEASRSADALECAKWAVILASNPAEKAEALIIQAEILVSLGEAQISLQFSQEALSLLPDNLSLFRPVVFAHKVLDDFSKNDWLNLFLEIETRYNISTADAKQGVLKSSHQIHIECLDIFTDSRFFSTSKLPNPDVMLTSLSLDLDDPREEAVFHALYETAERAEEYRRSWYYLQRRKMAHAKASNDFKTSERAVKKLQGQAKFMMQAFSDGSFSVPGSATLGNPTRIPVFIIGMFKSGSTLLESILFAHPEILTVGEESAISSRVHNILPDTLFSTDEDSQLYDIDAQGVVARVPDAKYLERVYSAFNGRAEKTLEEMNNHALRLLRHSSKFSNRSGESSVKHIVDKMLFNFMNIGLIHIMFPNATIIHIVRDPMDTAISCFTSHFANPGWTLTLDAIHDTFAVYLEVIAHFKRVLPGRLYEVQYERLVYDSEGTLRGILNHLQLQWDPNMMKYDEVNRTILTTSALQVKKKIYRNSIGSWKKYSQFLKKFAEKLYNTIIRLEKIENGLPFPNSINWKLDKKYDYHYHLRL
jgi:tetratricopeptide (TPR) repeat protein